MGRYIHVAGINWGPCVLNHKYHRHWNHGRPRIGFWGISWVRSIKPLFGGWGGVWPEGSIDPPCPPEMKTRPPQPLPVLRSSAQSSGVSRLTEVVFGQVRPARNMSTPPRSPPVIQSIRSAKKKRAKTVERNIFFPLKDHPTHPTYMTTGAGCNTIVSCCQQSLPRICRESVRAS